MKKILIALAFVAATATTAFAGTHTAPVLTAEQRVTYEVRSQLIIPPVLMEVPGEYRAEVHFHVAQDGHIAVDEVVSDNPTLVKSLRNQLKGYTVSTSGLNTENSYKVNVTFRVADSGHDNY